MNGRILVIDVGSTGARAAIVDADSSVDYVHYERTHPTTPFPGLLEFDAQELAATVIRLASAALDDASRDGKGDVVALGITNQRASTIVWDRVTGEPIGPALGWQDLRTVGECISAKAEHGLALAPNQSATKLAWFLNTYDASRSRDLCFGTVDSWLVWVLTEGRHHVTDHTNAGVTGLVDPSGVQWSDHAIEALRIPDRLLPQLVDSSGLIGAATALPGVPSIAGLAGDQQASLVGQSCVRPGLAKCTFGTGGMLDVVTGEQSPGSLARGSGGTFPIIAWSRDGRLTWGREAVMLTAGTNVDWLVDDMGILASASAATDVAASVPDAGGVSFVPALMGLGTPRWDYGACGTLLGLTRGTTAAHVVRAVLEGIAHRGADLMTAAEVDAGRRIDSLRVDGGMSANTVFVQALADACDRPVEVAAHAECTTLGAGYLAGLAVGVWSELSDVEQAWRPRTVVEPSAGRDHGAEREQWAAAVERAAGWIPALSALDF